MEFGGGGASDEVKAVGTTAGAAAASAPAPFPSVSFFFCLSDVGLPTTFPNTLFPAFIVVDTLFRKDISAAAAGATFDGVDITGASGVSLLSFSTSASALSCNIESLPVTSTSPA